MESIQFFYLYLTVICYPPQLCLHIGIYKFERLVDEINVNQANEQKIVGKILTTIIFFSAYLHSEH